MSRDCILECDTLIDNEGFQHKRNNVTEHLDEVLFTFSSVEHRFPYSEENSMKYIS